MEVTAPQIKNGIHSKREWNPLPKVSSIGARSHHTEPRFCGFGLTDISYCDLNRAGKRFKGATSAARNQPRRSCASHIIARHGRCNVHFAPATVTLS